MQAIIMAAGKGSRLGARTGGLPKSFVEIHGKKLIEYNLDILDEIGVEKIIIVTGYKEEAFEELTKDRLNVKLVYNPFYEKANVIGSFFMGMNELTDDFIYLHADTICEPQVIKKLARFENDINLPVDYKECDEEAMKVCFENGKVVKISKQIDIECAEGEFIGIASFKKSTIDNLRMATKEILRRGDFMEYFEAAIQVLVDKDEFHVGTINMKNDFWAEVDFEEDYIRARDAMPEYMYK